MKNFAKIENNIVTEIIELEESPGLEWIECGAGIRNIMPSVSYHYDSDLDFFYTPIMEE
jgi:hypothetical protein